MQALHAKVTKLHRDAVRRATARRASDRLRPAIPARVLLHMHRSTESTEFDHGGAAMRVRELMTDSVKTVSPGTPLQDVARLMRDEDIGSVPVAENDKLVGMVTDRDIVIRGLAEDAGLERRCARDVMSQQVLYCREDQTVEDVLKNMGEQQIRRLPVVDESKRLVGVVSIGDLSTRARATKTGEALKEISRPNSNAH
jgi:CBS domain-containing protein